MKSFRYFSSNYLPPISHKNHYGKISQIKLGNDSFMTSPDCNYTKTSFLTFYEEYLNIAKATFKAFKAPKESLPKFPTIFRHFHWKSRSLPFYDLKIEYSRYFTLSARMCFKHTSCFPIFFLVFSFSFASLVIFYIFLDDFCCAARW